MSDKSIGAATKTHLLLELVVEGPQEGEAAGRRVQVEEAVLVALTDRIPHHLA